MTDTLLKFQTILDEGEDLPAVAAAEAFEALRRAVDQPSIGRFLEAWAEKGVTAVELAECARILRDNCVRVETRHERFIDIVGTGGSRAKAFNVSTAAAFVVAGAGIPVAKHGNRAASSRTGSADALQELGVNIVAETDLARNCLDRIGICFMFAPKFHNLTRELAMARKALGRPTVFNLLGPLANPAGAPFQLIGIWNRDFLEPLAEAVRSLGTERTWIVHGEDGLDEITLNGRTHVAGIGRDGIEYFDLTPEDFGLERSTLSEFAGMTPSKSAGIVRDVLRGNANGTATDIVLLNAAAAILLCGFAEDPQDAVRLARESIASGAALSKLNQLIEETNG